MKSLFNFWGSLEQENKKPKAENYGGIAQLGEHLLCKQGVIGSIPIISTSASLKGLGLSSQGKESERNLGS